MEIIEKLSTQYDFPQWVIIASFLALALMAFLFLFLIVKIFEPKYKLYKQDRFEGMLWKWKYKGKTIIDLWCYCPGCGSMLHVDDENCKTTSNLGEKITFFVCNSCEEREVGRIKGGDRRYALKVVTRAILAKIRLKTFDIYSGK